MSTDWKLRLGYAWPGLPRLWMRGSWTALVLAVLAAFLLDAALLGTLVWKGLFAADVSLMLWVAVALVWIGGLAYNGLASTERPADQQSPRTTDTYPLAVQNYLKGNWFEAERLLTAALRRNVRDLQSRLLLATLLRRGGRLDEAEAQLDTLERFEGTEDWLPEIEAERQQIIEADEELQRAEASPAPETEQPEAQPREAA